MKDVQPNHSSNVTELRPLTVWKDYKSVWSSRLSHSFEYTSFPNVFVWQFEP